MNKLTLYHPNNPRYTVIPKDMQHAINLMAQGWVRIQATVVVSKPEAKK